MTLNEYKQFFADLGASLGLDVVYGNSRRILNRQSSELTYPCLWIEVPMKSYVRQGALKKRYSGAFVILETNDWDDETQQDDDLNDTAELTDKVLLRMEAAAEANVFEFEMHNNAQSDHLEYWSADSDWGWRTTFSLLAAMCQHVDCCPDEVWGDGTANQVWGGEENGGNWWGG